MLNPSVTVTAMLTGAWVALSTRTAAAMPTADHATRRHGAAISGDAVVAPATSAAR